MPEDTRSFLIICDDLDAPSGIFHHWAAFDIPPHWRELKEGHGAESLVNRFRQAINDFGRPGYSGPCPPSCEKAHRYLSGSMRSVSRHCLSAPPRHVWRSSHSRFRTFWNSPNWLAFIGGQCDVFQRVLRSDDAGTDEISNPKRRAREPVAVDQATAAPPEHVKPRLRRNESSQSRSGGSSSNSVSLRSSDVKMHVVHASLTVGPCAQAPSEPQAARSPALAGSESCNCGKIEG